MVQHYYTDTASVATLAAGISSGALTCTLDTFTGWPTSFPQDAIIARDTPSMERVEITGVAGSVATIVRGQSSTLATSHSLGDTFELVASERHFNAAEQHVNATTGAHGVTGSPVGTEGEQLVRDKTFQGAFVHRFSDALPASRPAGLTIDADTITADDGVWYNSTAAPTGKALRVSQSGVDRFTVAINGDTQARALAVSSGAAVTGALAVSGTTNLAGALTVAAGGAAVTGNSTVTGTLGVTGAATLASAALAGALSVGGASTLAGVTASGAVVAGSLTTAGALSVDGAATLTLPAASTVTRLTVRTRNAGKAFEVFNEAGVQIGYLDGTGKFHADGVIESDVGLLAYGGTVPTVASVPTLATITAPVNGQLAFDLSTRSLWERSAGAWVGYPASPHARYERSRGTVQTISNISITKVQFPTALDAHADVVATGASNIDWTLQRTGRWAITCQVPWVASAVGARLVWIGASPDTGANRYASDHKMSFSDNSFGVVQNFTLRRRFTAGDVVCVFAYQTSGGGTDIAPSNDAAGSTLTFDYLGL